MADPVSLILPAMGESVSEGIVSRWLKAVGDTVDEGEPVVEVTTDKVDVEVPAPATGRLTEIVAAEGETVAVGATLAVIAPGPAAAAGSRVRRLSPRQLKPARRHLHSALPSRTAPMLPRTAARHRAWLLTLTAPRPPQRSRRPRRLRLLLSRALRRHSTPTARTSTPRPWPGAPPRRTASTCMGCTVRVQGAS